MSKLETVRVRIKGMHGFFKINERDFDSSKHTLVGDAEVAEVVTTEEVVVVPPTVAEVKDQIDAAISLEDLTKIRETEEAGKGRKSVLSAIESKEDELTSDADD